MCTYIACGCIRKSLPPHVPVFYLFKSIVKQTEIISMFLDSVMSTFKYLTHISIGLMLSILFVLKYYAFYNHFWKIYHWMLKR